jgi:hypothetical protein
MHNTFKSLKEVFNKEESFKGLRQTIIYADVIVKFYNIFPGLEKVAVPLTCEKGVLKLKVENPAWRSELKYMESELIEKINQFFNEQRIIQIRFTG